MDEITVWVVTTPDLTGMQWPTYVEWTEEAARQAASQIPGSGVTTAELRPLSKAVDSYFRHRKLKDPDALKAFLFLVSEVGEMADALVEQMDEGWVRNHPDRKHKQPEKEGGDVLMMLVKTMQKLGYDPLQQMFEKWKLKGWV